MTTIDSVALINLVSGRSGGLLAVIPQCTKKENYFHFLAEFPVKLNGRNARIRKTYCSIDVIYFVRSIYEEKLLYIMSYLICHLTLTYFF